LNPRDELILELIRVVENAQVHHPQRDGDWMEPHDLRQILRLMYYLLTNMKYKYEVKA